VATHKPVIINELFGELCLPPEGEHWNVAYCKPRREKRVAEFAAKNLIHYYLPQLKTSKIYQRRKVVSTQPMFPGYIFLVLSVANKELVSQSGLIVNYIRVVNEQELLNDLSRICFTGKKEVPMKRALWLFKGLEVEITEGALKGMRGIVESHDKISEVRLQVDLLRQAVMVKIDPENIKIIGEYEIEEIEE
jgi:transcriptional antiterminator RfaH